MERGGVSVVVLVCVACYNVYSKVAMEVAVNVWIVKTLRARCEYCQEDVQGPVLCTDGGERWHPQCWTDFAVQMVNEAPAGPKGRPAMELTPEQKQARQRLMRLYGANMHRMRQFLEAGDEVSIIRGMLLLTKNKEIMLEVRHYGGPPPGWGKEEDARRLEELYAEL